MENNNLTGPLPPTIFNIISLETIDISNNSLSGNLLIDQCNHNLYWVDLSNNMLHGKIPSNLDRCSQLQWLTLSSNRFSEALPSEIGNLTALQRLDLSDNSFGGTYARFCMLSYKLQHLVKFCFLDH